MTRFFRSTIAFTAALAAVLAGPAVALQAQAAKGRTVTLTVGDTMTFDKTQIEAKPGELLHVVLKDEGTSPKAVMGHNFVVLKAGTNVDAFNKAAFNARATEYIPPSMKSAVLAKTKLAGPGDSVDVTFKAPLKPGSYTYLCSFPGHYAMGMKGTLVVK
jgi:azurin